MLGGYIGAGPRKLLERDMVFIFKRMLIIIHDMVFVFHFRSKTLKHFFATGACLLTIQGGSSWLPLSS